MNSSASEPRVTSANVTLDNCDREQIQYSNAVQPHAILVVAGQATLRILQASVNVTELQQGAVHDLLGRSVEDLFAPADRAAFREAIAKVRESAPPYHLLHVPLGGQPWDVFAHLMNGALLIEFERQGPHSREGQQRKLYAELRGGIARLTSSTTVVEFLDEAVHLIAHCTGFERVMAYRFQADGSGEVVAEAVQEGLERYLGLHYPAADIPKPARRLFSLTWVRHLPDVNYRPVPIVPETHPLTNDAVDLSYAFSRSVSVMYTEYLRNMGVHATMVLTLFKAGKLWGLISCMQHSGPWHLNIEVRGICEMLAQTISLLMSAKEDAEFASYRESLSRSVERLMMQSTQKRPISEALTSGETNLLTAMDASGAAVVLDGEITLIGKTPPAEGVRAIVDKVAPKVEDTWSSDFIARELELGDTPEAGGVAGLLAVRIGYPETDLVLWFRQEYRQTVSWAGDPAKLVVRSPGRETRLHPNGSFDVWRSEVHGRAKPWLDCELEFAAKLGRAVLDVVVERSREVARLNQDLQRRNRELEEFVYTASHDLKTPLRSIASYAQIVLRQGANRLDPADSGKIEHIVRLARRMDGVIEGLLRYSELGHASIVREDVDLNEVCSYTIDLLRADIDRQGAQVRIPRPMPTLKCDARWVSQILLNLMGNALKYTDKPEPVVEIGYRGEMPKPGVRRATPVVIYVKDNGIGIAPEHVNSIFRLFHRLHASDQFGGGTGLGLSIVARAVERHDGRLWVESEPGQGTAFFFTLSAGRERAD